MDSIPYSKTTAPKQTKKADLDGEVGDDDAGLPLPLQLDDDGAHLLLFYVIIIICWRMEVFFSI